MMNIKISTLVHGLLSVLMAFSNVHSEDCRQNGDYTTCYSKLTVEGRLEKARIENYTESSPNDLFPLFPSKNRRFRIHVEISVSHYENKDTEPLHPAFVSYLRKIRESCSPEQPRKVMLCGT